MIFALKISRSEQEPPPDIYGGMDEIQAGIKSHSNEEYESALGFITLKDATETIEAALTNISDLKNIATSTNVASTRETERQVSGALLSSGKIHPAYDKRGEGRIRPYGLRLPNLWRRGNRRENKRNGEWRNGEDQARKSKDNYYEHPGLKRPKPDVGNRDHARRGQFFR